MPSDQSLRNRKSSESRRPVELEFVLERFAVCLDHPAAQAQPRSDVCVAQSFRNRNEDLALAGSQGLVTLRLRAMIRQMAYHHASDIRSKFRFADQLPVSIFIT